MSELEIERLGGFAGFGPASHFRSRGRITLDTLSTADREAVERLFAAGGAADKPGTADAFRYRITRQTPAGPQTIEAAEHAVPAALSASVRDELE